MNKLTVSCERNVFILKLTGCPKTGHSERFYLQKSEKSDTSTFLACLRIWLQLNAVKRGEYMYEKPAEQTEKQVGPTEIVGVVVGMPPYHRRELVVLDLFSGTRGILVDAFVVGWIRRHASRICLVGE